MVELHVNFTNGIIEFGMLVEAETQVDAHIKGRNLVNRLRGYITAYGWRRYLTYFPYASYEQLL